MWRATPRRSRQSRDRAHHPAFAGPAKKVVLATREPERSKRAHTAGGPMPEPVHRYIPVPLGRIQLAELGEGPVVLLVHGFPESWYSWRHQLPALAAAGYRAVAIDVRGYGRSSKPAEIDEYRLVRLVADNVGVLDALGEQSAVVVGHDWGSPIAW